MLETGASLPGLTQLSESMESPLHTFIVSDMHLTEAHEPDETRPLWMAYKRREFYIDDEFAAFLDHIEEKSDRPVELILNGDIFDFDAVTKLPDEERHADWLERARGLGARNGRASSRCR